MSKRSISSLSLSGLATVALLLLGFLAYLALRGGSDRAIREDAKIKRGHAADTVVPPAMRFSAQPIGEPFTGRPWITHLKVVDLDRDGLPYVVVCDAQANEIRWIRQESRGEFAERVIGGTVPAPAHVDACDVDHDGDLDLLVASMGVIFPNNDLIGAVIIMENQGSDTWERRVVLEGVARVTDVRGADFDGDGDIDLVVGQFGYDQGEIRWLENRGGWQFASRQLLNLSGTTHTPVADLDGDGRPDFAALVSQEWEEIHLFRNLGGGEFRKSLVWGSTNEDYGSSGMAVGDLDRDGDLDLLYANGDAFDYFRPGPRPWHGVQWLRNERGTFRLHRIGDLPGAYSPICTDLDRDGDQDVVAVSGFNNWDDPRSVSMRAWVNDGYERFEAITLAHEPTHLLALDAGDMDGDGVPELITGGFHAYPPWERMSRVLLWKRQ